MPVSYTHLDVYKRQRKVNGLTGDYKVYPGHDALTTLREEQRTNPYLLSYDYDIYD